MGPNSQNPHHYKGVDKETGVKTKSLVCTPIVVNNRPIGVVEAVNKLGADDFSADDVQMLIVFANFAAIALNNARQYDKCVNIAEAFRVAAARDNWFTGDSPAIKKTWALTAKVAQVNSTVLITGESGSGKEIIASAIHRQSARRLNPFICLNCAALESNLLTSELFGHEKGAYTGADSRRLGRFELARTGTIFLDEIVDAEASVQAKLLRVLENRQFERLGGSEPIRTDARVIAATNTDIEAAVAKGRFRNDLYHRLNVIRIHVPPLRERKSDIPGLFAYFAERFAAEMHVPNLKAGKEVMSILQNYAWPGNVRELKNLVERACVLCQDTELTTRDIDELFPYIKCSAQHTGIKGTQPETLWESERMMIEQALAENNGNQAGAARKLGISRHHLRYRLKKFNIQPNRKSNT